ncbi:hypothetical protein N7520_003560 [Penicillium odoratum]|uniref:uncharacterized protein n=1 Tax=Penicillium odoratum TaxID=1167516 RepID=UPI002549AD4F|nr:uncharacterized protein N7520_003560 [Penicillium odoratum]KAJ5769001.1 hypothetical protein N7520_003560 [Penicillium odoratum]
MSFPLTKITYKPLIHPAEHPAYRYNGFHPGRVTTLRKGHVKQPGFQAFPVDVTWEQDSAIPMRDGIKLYADIFRPTHGDKIPAIIPYSPYGKVDSGVLSYDNMGPYRMGIPFQRLSGYETFEGPNPAEWAERGYAVVDIDARGVGHSEGNVAFWGQQEAEDIYDSITWVSQQPWCSGSVVLAGNSWLSIAQTNFVSRFTHSALKAIAPWEGLSDPYTQQACRGGIPNVPFNEMIVSSFGGLSNVEDLASMIREHPLYDEYWESKKIDTTKMGNIPAYFTASYSTGLHSEGSFEGYRTASTAKKWLRVHNSQEWHDLYTVAANDDLQRFFDFYAKGIQNGWEDTPRVRLTLLGFEDSPAKSVIERAEAQWPPARLRTERYFLDAATGSLTSSRPQNSSKSVHEGHSLTDSSDFKLVFPDYTELCGRPFVKLFMSAPSHDEIDVVVQIRKLSASGNLLESLNWSPMPLPAPKVPNVNVAKHLGPQGMLRASHRVSIMPRSSENDVPCYDHRSRQPISPGKIVELMVPIWPIGVVYEPGEGLLLRISGHDMSLPETEALKPLEPRDENKGQHIVHTGGDYDSYLVLPRIA